MTLLCFILLHYCAPQPAADAGLRVVLNNIKTPKGQILLGIYDSEAAFLRPEKAKIKRIVSVTAKGFLSVDITDLPAGTYAVSCFHDLNGNGELDTNWVGIPSEPYAFSNNARPKFRAPNWWEARFGLDAGGGQIDLRLEKW